MSLKAVPGRNAGTDVFFTFTVSPVLGLRGRREHGKAGRHSRLEEPRRDHGRHHREPFDDLPGCRFQPGQPGQPGQYRVGDRGRGTVAYRPAVGDVPRAGQTSSGAGAGTRAAGEQSKRSLSRVWTWGLADFTSNQPLWMTTYLYW